MIKGWHSLARLDRNLKLALLANLCVGFSFVGISSLLFNFFLDGLNFDPVFIGNLNGIGLLAFTLSALPSGILGARFGLRGTAMTGDFIAGLGIAGFLLSALLPHTVWHTSMMVTLGIAYAGGAMGMVNLVSIDHSQRSAADAVETAGGLTDAGLQLYRGWRLCAHGGVLSPTGDRFSHGVRLRPDDELNRGGAQPVWTGDCLRSMGADCLRDHQHQLVAENGYRRAERGTDYCRGRLPGPLPGKRSRS